MARLHDAAAAEDRPSESDADAFDGMLEDKRPTDFAHLLPNAFRAAVRIDVSPLEGDELRSISGPHAELELRPADFNAQVHHSSTVENCE
jgi:hypothetical protein